MGMGSGLPFGANKIGAHITYERTVKLAPPKTMSLRVFAWDSNPAVDQPSYRLNNKRAAQMVNEGQARLIRIEGRTALQKYPPPEERIIHGGYSDAWKMIPSGGIPVWQMVRT